MVNEYGMSERLAHVYFADERRPAFLEAGRESGSGCSEATAELIDSQVREIIGRQYAKALKILRKKKPVLMEAARLLLKKGKIEGDDLKALLQETDPDSTAE